MATSVVHYPMKKHFKSRFQMLRRPRLAEVVSTDTVFSNTKSIEGFFCSHFFYGVKSRTIYIVGMQTESDFLNAYKDFIKQVGIPAGLHRDNALSEQSEEVIQLNRDLIVHDSFTEPHHPHQNPVESQAVRHIKNWSKLLLDRSGAPDNCWYLCQEYCAYIYNYTANPMLNWLLPLQVRDGDTKDISHILMFYWFEPVLYLDENAPYPETNELPGYFVGFVDNVGDAMTFKILNQAKTKIFYRSVVRSAMDPNTRNNRVDFGSLTNQNLHLWALKLTDKCSKTAISLSALTHKTGDF